MGSGQQPEHVMEALLDLLAEAPELRVGQAIALATHRLTGQFDPFNVEDAQLAKTLGQLTEQYRRAKSTR
jgi:hypothetical protein